MKSMIKNIYTGLLAILVLIVCTRCKQPYVYPESATVTNFLHVEGVINTSADTTFFQLSRTVKLTEAVNSKPELNAAVSVEDPNGNVFQLTDNGNGTYFFPGFSFLGNISQTWRLDIVTSDYKVYQSDFVPIKNSPPIDSIYYKINGNGLQVYSSAHDPKNSTWYYRWDFDETWVVYSFYDSHLIIRHNPNNYIDYRRREEQIDSCWMFGSSNSLILNSSAKLLQDVITDNPVIAIPSTSEKVSAGYSLNLHQHALTKEGFAYWQNLKKNTEQLGSIFDAQPSQIQGNIHCISDPAEPVLGYVSAGADASKRFFIRKAALPNWHADNPFASCKLDTLDLQSLGNVLYTNTPPIDGVYNKQAKLVGYSFTITSVCVDCTVRGTNKQPYYWK